MAPYRSINHGRTIYNHIINVRLNLVKFCRATLQGIMVSPCISNPTRIGEDNFLVTNSLHDTNVNMRHAADKVRFANFIGLQG